MFCHIKIVLQQKNKNCFKKIHYQLFNNQPIELRSSSEIDNIIQEGEVIFKKSLTVGLPEESKLPYLNPASYLNLINQVVFCTLPKS